MNTPSETAELLPCGCRAGQCWTDPPPCMHGQPAGNRRHPDTGHRLCPYCQIVDESKQPGLRAGGGV